MIKQGLQATRKRVANWFVGGRGRKADAIVLPSPVKPRAIVSSGFSFERDLGLYLRCEALNTAVDRVAIHAASSPLQVKDTAGKFVLDHPHLQLLGPHGKPNGYQSSFEFFELHFQRMDVFGNDFWYFHAYDSGYGPPTEVHQLDPRAVQIRVVGEQAYYLYTDAGGQRPLPAGQVLHFKRAGMQDSTALWGASVVSKIRGAVEADILMANWNRDFFSIGLPSGIIPVPPETTDEEMAELKAQLRDFHQNSRSFAVLRMRAGTAGFTPAGYKQREMEFKDGVKLLRQVIFDATGFHAGLVSESSTEAHARIAERQVRQAAYHRQLRCLGVLNKALQAWLGWPGYYLQFGDVRLVDWQQNKTMVETLLMIYERDELKHLFLDELGKS